MELLNKLDFSKNDGLVTRVIVDETLVVPVRGTLASLRQIFALNPVAAFVWERIDGETSLDAILTDVRERFEVTREEARVDLEELIAGLLEADMLLDVEDTPTATPGP